MIRHLVQRLPGGKSLAVVLVAAAVAVGGLTMSSVSAPQASAQCLSIFCGYNGYNGFPYYGYNGYNSLGYNAYGYGYSYPYNYGYTYPYNYGYYGYPYSYTYPYNSYSSYYPYSNSIYNNYSYPYSSYYTPGVSAYSAVPTTSAYTATQPAIYAGAAPAYMTSGSYCMVGSEQVWVPSGASPESYGCTGSSTGS